MYTPKNDVECTMYIEELYIEFTALLTWSHSVTGDTLRTGFCVPPAWLPPIRNLLSNIQTLDTLHCIDRPIFRDFKAKRGYLCVNYDGGCHIVDHMIDILEAATNQ